MRAVIVPYCSSDANLFVLSFVEAKVELIIFSVIGGFILVFFLFGAIHNPKLAVKSIAKYRTSTGLSIVQCSWHFRKP